MKLIFYSIDPSSVRLFITLSQVIRFQFRKRLLSNHCNFTAYKLRTRSRTQYTRTSITQYSQFPGTGTRKFQFSLFSFEFEFGNVSGLTWLAASELHKAVKRASIFAVLFVNNKMLNASTFLQEKLFFSLTHFHVFSPVSNCVVSASIHNFFYCRIQHTHGAVHTTCVRVDDDK